MDVSRLDFMKAAALGLAGAAVAGCTTTGATCCATSTAAPKEPPKKKVPFAFGMAGFTMCKRTLD